MPLRLRHPAGLPARFRLHLWTAAALHVALLAWLPNPAVAQMHRLPPLRSTAGWLQQDVGYELPALSRLPDEEPVAETVEFAPAALSPCCFRWQILPQGVIYRSYLAGAKESRFRSVWANEKDGGGIWDIALGGRAGLIRYGTTGDARPQGFQIGIEGAGLPRLDLEEDRDVDAVDFRFGVPITWGDCRQQFKLAYYHLSSHLGDEFLLKNPGFTRLNYSRDEIVFGYSYYATDRLRLYAEAGWAFFADVAKPWEFQFGLDYSPGTATGRRGAPFFAFNGHLREEVKFGGNLVVQAGWAWRRSPASGLFRAGFEFYSGESDQFSFFDQSESKVGLALWYDF